MEGPPWLARTGVVQHERKHTLETEKKRPMELSWERRCTVCGAWFRLGRVNGH